MIKAHPLLLLSAALFFSACSSKPASTSLDLHEVPERVAVILPKNAEELLVGIQAIGASVDRTVTLTNIGITSATKIQEDKDKNSDGPFTFKDGKYPGTGGTCGRKLAHDDTCTVVVTFTPTEAGTIQGGLNLKYDNGVLLFPVKLPLGGQTPGVLTLSDGPSFDFGIRAKGTVQEQTFTLTNTSDVLPALVIADSSITPLPAPFTYKGGIFPGIGGTCLPILNVSASCTIVLTFAPTAAATQLYGAEWALEYDDGRGQGIATATITQTLIGKSQAGWNSLTGTLSARTHATSVWTGSEAVFWGGQQDAATRFKDGARYNPVTHVWTPTQSAGAPTERAYHSAIWTSGLSTPRMIVWGGIDSDGNYLNTGSMYDPAADAWTDITTTGAPTARYGHTAIWDSVRSRMIIWGGADDSVLNASLGFSFDPTFGAHGKWTAISSVSEPSSRYFHTAVWTGTEMIIWGGCKAKNAGLSCQINQETGTGARYNPGTNAWAPLTTTSAPTARFLHSALWTGDKMVLWGGGTDQNGDGASLIAVANGAHYLPPSLGTEAWTSLSAVSAPSARLQPLLALRGSELMVWGGVNASGSGAILNLTAFASDPTTAWTAMSLTSAPTSTYGITGVYTGDTDRRWITYGADQASLYAPE